MKSDDRIFTGTTANYTSTIILAIILQAPASGYIQYAGSYGGDSNIVILSIIGVIVSLIISFMTVFARLSYLQRNHLLVILLIIPLIGLIFCITLMFLQPKTHQKQNDEVVKNKNNIDSKSPSSHDEEKKELERKIEIAELKKKLKKLEDDML